MCKLNAYEKAYDLAQTLFRSGLARSGRFNEYLLNGEWVRFRLKREFLSWVASVGHPLDESDEDLPEILYFLMKRRFFKEPG